MKEKKRAFIEAVRVEETDAAFNRISSVGSAVLSCGNVQQQVLALQSLIKSDGGNVDSFLELLVVLYFAAETGDKSAVRKVCFGAIRDVDREKIVPILHNRLVYLIGQCKDEVSCVDSIALLSSWNSGLEALQISLFKVLQYLSRAMHRVKCPTGCSSQEKERCYNTASKIARCASTLASYEMNNSFVANIAASVKQLLLDDDTMLSCRISCGVSLPEILHKNTNIPSKEIYSSYKADFVSHPMSFVCLIAGLINITNMKSELDLFEELLNELIRMGTADEYQKDPPFILSCVRTVLQWTLRLAQFQNECAVLVETKMRTLLEFSFLNIEHFVDAVQHQGKALFKVLIDILVESEGEGKHQQFLVDTFKKLMKEPWYKKAKFSPMFSISKYVQVSECITYDNVIELYAAVKEKSMFPYVEDFVRIVSGKHFEEDPVSWEHVWLNSFFVAFNSGDCPMVEDLLPLLIKIRPETQQSLIEQARNDNKYLVLAMKALTLGELVKSESILGRAQWSTSESVRISLLKSLCDSPRTCELVDSSLLPHLKTFIKLNISTQSQSFRQAMLACLKKLILRCKASDEHFKNVSQKKQLQPQEVTAIKAQQEFVLWFWDFCLKQLHPGCSYFTRSSALALLELLSQLAGDDPEGRWWNPQRVNTILHCIKDTYEVNKECVKAVLTRAPKHLLPFGNVGQCTEKNEFLDTCLSYTRSARPPDCVTAAYCLTLYAEHATADEKFEIFNRLVEELKQQLLTAGTEGLLEASSSSPMYGALVCLRSLVNQYLAVNLPEHLKPKYQILIGVLVKTCLEIADIVRPFITNPSPEGQLDFHDSPELIEQFKAALNKGFGKKLEKADAIKAYAVTSQMLSLCCWRAHKEISLLFGDLASHLKVILVNKLMQESEFFRLGDYFMSELCTVRHRGAFEQAYTGFTKLCSALWRSDSLELQQLPNKWLLELMDKIDRDEVSATRRSAGIPFIVQAVVVTEPEVNGNKALHSAMQCLLKFATDGASSDQTKVHALNVLRALYRDTRLGESVMCYVASGMCTSLGGFDHPVWGIRNSCTLLFSALVTRIFGVNRSKQDVERKNCLTGNIFFQRFPELFPFLIDRISSLAGNHEKQTGLYPILLLLGRLYPSLNESKLCEFLPLLDKCVLSPIYNVRLAGAKAFATLLPIEMRTLVLKRKLGLLKDKNVRKNLLHGTVLQIQYILKADKSLIDEVVEDVKTISWIGVDDCSMAAAAYIQILLDNNVRIDEILFSKTAYNVIARDMLEHALTKYRLTHGVKPEVHTYDQKIAALQFYNFECAPSAVDISLAKEVIESKRKEHPKAVRLAYELASNYASSLPNQLPLMITTLSQINSMSHPKIMIAMFSMCGNMVPYLKTDLPEPKLIELIHEYSFPNQDPDMRNCASQAFLNCVKTYGDSWFVMDYHKIFEAVINLVLDNEVSVRNRIIDALSCLVEKELENKTPLECCFILAKNADKSEGKLEFQKIVLVHCLATEESPVDVDIDEQPFEKGELNTFYDTITLASICAKVAEGVPFTKSNADICAILQGINDEQLELEEKISKLSNSYIATNRQLDTDLMRLGQIYFTRKITGDQISSRKEAVVNNVFFTQFYN